MQSLPLLHPHNLVGGGGVAAQETPESEGWMEHKLHGARWPPIPHTKSESWDTGLDPWGGKRLKKGLDVSPAGPDLYSMILTWCVG